MMATGHVIRLKGFAIGKKGELVRKPHRQSVSAKLHERKSKRIRPVRRRIIQ